ncbi:MAG: flagellar biosynthesis protein FlhB [Rhizobiales bacterium]|nr:flagellar biosynthesis protein FlhB [Hyphomicrobiales bacterium]
MAEDQDRENRTEEPTEKRISDALERGNVPFSREAVALGSLLGILVALKFVLAWSGSRIGAGLASLLDGAGSIRLEGHPDTSILLTRTAFDIGMAAIPVFAVLGLAGLAASLFQNTPQASLERITPKLSRISPIGGWRRLFGIGALVEFGKSVGKIVAVAAIAGLVLKSQVGATINVLQVDPLHLPATIADLLIEIVLPLCAVSVGLAAADIAWSRYRWRRDLRMTRQELKDEHRQAEGDVQIKLRIRAIARQRVSRRMMARLPTATVVIANPTHFAVALRYLRGEGGAPLVIAKGVDHLALRIRELAEAHEIPVVENQPLARSLYEKVELDQAIPAEFYRAVAEIIHFLQVRRMYTAPATRQ